MGGRFSPITVLPGRSTPSGRKPKNVVKRLESRRRRHSGEDPMLEAEERREQIRQERKERVQEHHKRVQEIVAKRLLKQKGGKLTLKQSQAEERRRVLQEQRQQRIKEHHMRITHLKTRSPRIGSHHVRYHQRLVQAEARRREMMEQQQTALEQHHKKVSTAHERKEETIQKVEELTMKAIEGYTSALDCEAIAEADFERMQRCLMNRNTMSQAKELLKLISSKLMKVRTEEKVQVTDDTPVNVSPKKPVQLNPRVFLSAYMCMGGLTEGTEPGPLETAVQEHAATLIASFQALLEYLETDALMDSPEAKVGIKHFARSWEAYEQSFEIWKRNDHECLLDHYMNVYSEFERGRVEIVNRTLHGSRRPNEQAELVASIEDSLEKIRQQIERLGGESAVDQLSKRLQEMYDDPNLGLTPPSRPRGSAPSMSFSPGRSGGNTPTAASSSGMMPSPMPSPSLTPRNERITTPRKVPDSPTPRTPTPSDGLRSLLLRAKLAHDAVFSEKACAPVEESTEKQTMDMVMEAAKRAFWDVLTEELGQDPPKIDRVGGVLEGLKEQVLDVAPKKLHAELQQEMKDSIDWDVLKLTFNAEALASIVKYFMGKVLEYQAPSENEATKIAIGAQLQEIEAGPFATVVLSTLKFLHEKLETLKKQVHEARKNLLKPVLARDAEPVIRELVQLELQERMHSFEGTEEWLRATLCSHVPLTPDSTPSEYAVSLTVDDVLGKTGKLYTLVPQLGIVDLVFNPSALTGYKKFPETLFLHRDIMRRLADQVQVLVLSAVITSTVGQLASAQANASGKGGAVPTIMKEIAAVCTQLLTTPGIRLPTVCEQVMHATDDALISAGLKPLPQEQLELLVGKDGSGGMISKVANVEDTVFKAFVKTLLTHTAQCVQGEAPPLTGPFGAMAKQVSEFTALLTKLCKYNAQWFHPFHVQVLNKIVDDLKEQRQTALDSDEL